jgi:prepilin-type N-terminal cleavage/methylation domain-containing protein
LKKEMIWYIKIIGNYTMNVKYQKAFTMIEVVFVIVVIGILAAVALPRFGKIGEDAHLTKIQTFVDILNRTVGPNMWSSIQRNVPTAKGSVKHADVAGIAKYSSLFDPQTATPSNAADAQIREIPTELTTNADGVTGAGSTHDIPLSNCADANTSISAGIGRIASAKIGDVIYNIGCIDGSLALSTHFFLDDGTRILKK